MCVFEYVYTARPDSAICGCSVHEARKRAGAFLAKAHPVEADVVVGVPDSGLDAALGYAEESGIPYGIGLIKNKYIGRTFIAPGQNVREDKVKIKLNPVSATVKGKRVVLVDDSIVRGTTCARIVKLLRNAGAKEVHLRSSAPAFLNPCYYGTDVDSKESLIACNHTIEEMTKLFDVDTLGYLPLEDVSKLGASGTCKGYCTACFDGNYPTETPEKYVNKFDHKISENN
jgi:amidophosphoribosyltransferase